MSIGIWLYEVYINKLEIKGCETLACIEESDLVKNVNLENYDNEDLYELVNESDLEEKQQKRILKNGIKTKK